MPRGVLDEVWRTHWGRLLGQLIHRFGRPDLVEDALADAFAEAASRWPVEGVPDNPVGWVRTVAHRRVVDALRREGTARAKAHLLVDDDVASPADAPDPPGADTDDRLALLLMATHPALAEEVRPALALRFVLGVPTADIARLFLVPQATMAARLTRAKRRLTTAGIPFTVPDAAEWPDRLDDVARAVYLAFTAAYAPSGGEDVLRVAEAGEAVRLAGLAAELLPGQPVLEALAALLTLQHARRDARTSPAGRPVRLADQDRSRWRREEIDAGLRRLTALTPTSGLAEELRLQALVAAFHDTAASHAETDWAAIARTYARLEELTGSAVVRLNRAVAVGEASGPMAGLAVLRAAADQLPGHHRVALVRAELLRRDGEVALAAAAYDEAAATCPDGVERDHIRERRASLTAPGRADADGGGH
ncbi:RNA polymerase sigma factor [Oceanitalea stevensii]|uniref:RNA polymerase subunit sigma-24 n=1 Tax=Oceanitalea stevensii TaxID=2763072 RepID=A0ABR8Z2P5_9MICO|nr:DUF6596 domain-containing protein [Oceanitalea stevensii]MBD8062598.1 RNA polymerase subunit sigma-24 [Oceanitalea stevensii]